MKYIFFGTPEFAAIILERLIEAGIPPAAVVCNPDRPVGRKKNITAPPVKQRIMNYELGIRGQIKIFQPEKLDKKFHDSLFIIHALTPLDFFIVAAYAKILPKEIIQLPRLGTIGVHPSLLSKYRGSTPIQTAILNGEKETGSTLFLMDEKMDHGPILRNEKLVIRNEDDYETLIRKLAKLSADLLIETIPKFVKGEIEPQRQNETEATYTKKFFVGGGLASGGKTDAFVLPEDLESARAGENPEKAAEIWRKIRALNPEPGVWTFRQIKGKQQRMKILEAEIKERKLKLKKIQIEGKKPTLKFL